MRRIIALLLVAVMVAGCTGSFELTKKVYNFHRGMDDKWMDEMAFIVVAYLPVYAIAILGDAIIFNTVEFWTDKNPIEAKRATNLKVVEKDGLRAAMAYNPEDESIKVVSYKSGQRLSAFVLEKNSDCVVMKNNDGEVIYTSTKDKDGGITIQDADGQLVKYISPEEVISQKEKMIS